MPWNYRLVHRYDEILEEHIYAIHEAFYDEGSKTPHSISENPSYPQADTWEAFTHEFARYQKGYLQGRRRILEYADFNKTNQDDAVTPSCNGGKFNEREK